MDKIKNIYKHKKSDTAVFLGSAQSINNITKEQWDIISKVDSWTVNNWIYHPFIPNFFHPEVKKYGKDIWKKRKQQKGDAYKDTVFIINMNPKRKKTTTDIIGPEKYIYEYKMSKINVVKKPIVPEYTMSKNPNVLTCNLNSSFTMILELFYKFKYKRVILFGVDFTHSKYFWTGKPEFGEVHCQTNKDHEGKKPNSPHNTAHTMNFIKWFSKEKMKEVGGEIFVGYKDTLLYPDLRYFNIEKLEGDIR